MDIQELIDEFDKDAPGFKESVAEAVEELEQLKQDMGEDAYYEMMGNIFVDYDGRE